MTLRDTHIDGGGHTGWGSRHARDTRKVLRGAEKPLACQSTPVLQPKNKPGFVVWGGFHWLSAENRHGQASSHHSPSCKIPRPLSFLHLSAHPSPILLSVFSTSSLPPHPFRTRPLPSFLAIHSGSLKTQLHPCLSFSLLSVFLNYCCSFKWGHRCLASMVFAV